MAGWEIGGMAEKNGFYGSIFSLLVDTWTRFGFEVIAVRRLHFPYWIEQRHLNGEVLKQ